jgi:glutathione S-transferase
MGCFESEGYRCLNLSRHNFGLCPEGAVDVGEKGLAWQSHLMALNGDQLDPAYLKLNPNGVVPTLVHDGNVSSSRR